MDEKVSEKDCRKGFLARRTHSSCICYQPPGRFSIMEPTENKTHLSALLAAIEPLGNDSLPNIDFMQNKIRQHIRIA